MTAGTIFDRNVDRTESMTLRVLMSSKLEMALSRMKNASSSKNRLSPIKLDNYRLLNYNVTKALFGTTHDYAFFI